VVGWGGNKAMVGRGTFTLYKHESTAWIGIMQVIKFNDS
jgi:hypothetical protein